MIDEAKMAQPSELSPRAAIALMSLQLRSTVQEAVEAEAEADAVDVDAALWQLRSRLAPLIEDRRRALEREVAAERERAAEQIAAAHLEADRILAAAVEAAAARVAAEAEAARVADEDAAAPAPEPELVLTTLLPLDPMADPLDAAPQADSRLFDDPMIEWAPDEPVEAVPPPVPLSSTPPTLPMPVIDSVVPPPPPPSAANSPWAAPDVAHVERSSMYVMIDAESFARAFAVAIAPALENRQAPLQLPPQGWMPYQAPAPKKSFWSHAWHPDVLLSGLAMVIVIIVLVAWTG